MRRQVLGQRINEKIERIGTGYGVCGDAVDGECGIRDLWVLRSTQRSALPSKNAYAADEYTQVITVKTRWDCIRTQIAGTVFDGTSGDGSISIEIADVGSGG